MDYGYRQCVPARTSSFPTCRMLLWIVNHVVLNMRGFLSDQIGAAFQVQ